MYNDIFDAYHPSCPILFKEWKMEWHGHDKMEVTDDHKAHKWLPSCPIHVMPSIHPMDRLGWDCRRQTNSLNIRPSNNHLPSPPINFYVYFNAICWKLAQIWIPNLIFNNSLNDAYVEGDVLSSVRVQRQSPPIVNSISELEEKYLYRGTQNPFVFTRYRFNIIMKKMIFHCVSKSFWHIHPLLFQKNSELMITTPNFNQFLLRYLLQGRTIQPWTIIFFCFVYY